MASMTLTAFDAALKEYYTKDKIENMVYKNNPLLTIISKMEDFVGDALPIPVLYGNPQGRSATFATASTNKAASKLVKFVLTRVKNYGLADIDREVILASKGNAGSFMDALTTEIDGVMHNLSRNLAIDLYRAGTGAICRVNNSSFATTLLDLVTDADAVNFEVGQVLVLDDADGGGTVRTGTLTVTAVDAEATSDQITLSGNISSGVSAVAQNDYIFVEGDYDLKIKGLQAWIPNSAPAATSFFGVDRTVHSRLGGLRYDGSALVIDEALINAASKVGRQGGKPDYCFMPFEQFSNLEKTLGSRVVYETVGEGELGFSAIVLRAPTGNIKIVADQNCPANRAFMLQMDTWNLYSLGPSPHMFEDEDGLRILRNATTDSYEVRCGYYANLGCKAPGYNCNISLAS